ncbi:ribonuclease MRP protein subunit rmp1-like [Teratosphaeria destructans]|uniref:Ribonuclease MRP protein subunit rmp1-like n=1 Tax=Teratosphaeria destructans TaxID=418781 RepID=A0A9W7W5Q5_9PEZI|nr:ribonuclease MRP protein subunit rmp1-like [Teratosphaeria destructans]
MFAAAEAVSEEDRQTLRHLSDLLHVFHHRNNNQHRRSTWWRHFSIFRRQLTCLSNEIRSLHEFPTTHLEKAKKKSRDQQIRKQLEQRISFWQDVMVTRWQHAFSQIASDGRFSVLGLVLLAALAEACRITSITTAIEDLGQGEVEKVLAKFAEESREDCGNHMAKPSTFTDHEDYGEVVARGQIGEGRVESNEIAKAKDVTSTMSTKNAAIAVHSKQGVKRSGSRIIDFGKRKRQKKPKGDAIDDLFSGLG